MRLLNSNNIPQCVFNSACLNPSNFHWLYANCFHILLMGIFLFNTPETCEMPVPDSPGWSSLHAVSMPRVPCWQSIWDTNCCPFLWGWWPLREQFSRLVSVPISARFQVTDVDLLHPFCIIWKSIQSFPTRFWLLLLFKTFQLIVSCQPEFQPLSVTAVSPCLHFSATDCDWTAVLVCVLLHQFHSRHAMQFPTLCLFWTPVFWISNSLVFRGPHLLFSYAKQVGIFLLTLSFSFSGIVCFYSWSNLLVVQVNTIRTKGQCQTVINFLTSMFPYLFSWSLFSMIIFLINLVVVSHIVLSSWHAFAFSRHLFSSPQFSSTSPPPIVLSSYKLVLSFHLFIGPI